MKKLVLIFLVSILTAILSGCIISATPDSDNQVYGHQGESITFEIQTYPEQALCVWTLGDQVIEGVTGNSCTITPTWVNSCKDLSVEVKNGSFGKNRLVWQVACIGSVIYNVSTSDELQTALNIAAVNEQDITIHIAKGTYYGNFNLDGTNALPLAYNIVIEGGYSPDFASRDINPQNTIIDGSNKGRALTLYAPNSDINFIIEGVTIQNGYVIEQNGGGVSIETKGNVIVKNSIIQNNKHVIIGSSAQNKYGVGLYATGCNMVTIFNNSIISNRDDGCASGGLCIANCGTAIINNNNISNNITSAEAGGLYILATNKAEVSNNIINGNSSGFSFQQVNQLNLINNVICSSATVYVPSGQGWGVKLSPNNSNINIINNTIANNPSVGLICYNQNAPYSNVNLINNVFWNNNNEGESDFADMYINNSVNWLPIYAQIILLNNDFDQSPYGFYIAQQNFSIDQSNLNKVDPKFVALGDQYGDQYYDITAGSPCIDAGNNNVSNLPYSDIVGNPRILDGNDDGVAYIDMGAYEYKP